jgi:hypothetical protein
MTDSGVSGREFELLACVEPDLVEIMPRPAAIHDDEPAVGIEHEKGMVQTVEGNSNAQGSREGGGVWKQTRKLSQIRSRIRFTV